MRILLFIEIIDLILLVKSEGIKNETKPQGEHISLDSKVSDKEQARHNALNVNNSLETNNKEIIRLPADSNNYISQSETTKMSENYLTSRSDLNISDNYNYSLYNTSSFYKEEDYLEYIFPKPWMWPLIFFHSVGFVIGIVGNCLVCIAVYRNHTMRTVTNYFIVNLAVADFLVILFCLPPSVVWDVTSTWWFGTMMCKIVLYLQSVSVTVSILTLTFISIDRWYAICFPLKFKSTTGRAKTAIGIIWIVALAFEIPEGMYLTAKPYPDNPDIIYFTQCLPTWSDETDTIFMVIKMAAFYLLPLLFMSVAYIQIIRVLWKSGNVPHQAMDATSGNNPRAGGGPLVNTFAMNMNASTEGQLRSRRKAAKMLVCVVVMFAICFLPVHLLSVLRLTVKLTNSEMNQALSLISHWLCYTNSAVNPIIYNFMSGKFRKEFRRAFDSCCQRHSKQRGRDDFHCSTFCSQKQLNIVNADSGINSRTPSRTDFEIHRMDTYSSGYMARKGTKHSVLQVDI